MDFTQLTHLIPMKPELAENLVNNNHDISAVTGDTRQVTEGSCFVAIKGFTFDGHQHIQEAIDQGAIIVIIQNDVSTHFSVPVIKVPDTKKTMAQLSAIFFGNPSKELLTVGVTGTNGKTTITNLVDNILTDNQIPTGLMGTIYNDVGDKKIASINTTPDAYTIQSSLAEMKDQGYKAAAMEVSSIALEQGRTWGTDYDIAVFTNLTEDHLDYHKTMENYFDAKTLLFSQLGNTYSDNQYPKTAIINIDDPAGQRLLDKTAANIIRYAIDDQTADLRAFNIQMAADHTTFDFSFADDQYTITTHLVGMFNVYNTLAAIGVGIAAGITPQAVIDSLQKSAPVTGRFQIIPNEQGIVPIVDYAHTPDGLEQVLDTIDELPHNRVFCVVGAGGDRDSNKRHIMGEIAYQKSSDPIYTSDNPRTEDPEMILRDVVSTLPENAKYTMITDRKEAIEFALSNAKQGDVVLVAGKGHEDYQIIGKTKHHFSDKEVIENFLNK